MIRRLDVFLSISQVCNFTSETGDHVDNYHLKIRKPRARMLACTRALANTYNTECTHTPSHLHTSTQAQNDIKCQTKVNLA